MIIINDNDVCPKCGAYWQGNGYCCNGHSKPSSDIPCDLCGKEGSRRYDIHPKDSVRLCSECSEDMRQYIKNEWDKRRIIKHNICVKHNNTATNDPCAICGQRTDPYWGAELFLEGTWSLVCTDCGLKYAPELVKITHPGEYDWYTKNTKVAMCSKCKRKGTDDNPIFVIGNDEDRVSACCKAKVVLVKRGVWDGK
jgi:ribosome-binding protein aMBF1 (putative translation factor)